MNEILRIYQGAPNNHNFLKLASRQYSVVQWEKGQEQIENYT